MKISIKQQSANNVTEILYSYVTFIKLRKELNDVWTLVTYVS